MGAATSASFAAAGSGQVVEYELQRRLGHGTFGEVLLAVSPRLGSAAVAIKLLKKRTGEDIEEKLRELKTLSRLRDCPHPNVLHTQAAYDLSTKDAPKFTGKGSDKVTRHLFTHAIVMDLGVHSLTQEIQRVAQAVAPGLTRRWSREIMTGLMHIHSHGIMHRDLKPQNIMLVLDPATCVLRAALIDMGSTRPVLPRSVDVQMTRNCEIGTCWYRAPELCLVTPAPQVCF